MNYRKIVLPAFILMAIVQMAVPASMIIRYETTLSSGKQFKFKTAPVDPYDAFRGRFVALNIEGNNAEVPTGTNFVAGEKVYGQINIDKKGFAFMDKVSREKPDSGDYLKTVVNYSANAGKVSLALPFNRYYMEEESAPLAEQAYNRRSNIITNDAYITVRILNGNGVIEGLFIGGKTILEYIKENPEKN